MKFPFLKSIGYLILCIFLGSCQFIQPEKEEEAEAKTSQPSNQVVFVQVAESKEKDFHLQILATGKVSAHIQAKINFKTNGVIQQIFVRNSSQVNQGQVLAVLDNDQQKILVQQALDAFHDARLELNKLVLEYGGRDRDTNSVSKRILENLKSKSGYNKAQTNLSDAKLKLEQTFLKAPYSGIIANLKTKAYNSATNEPFCTIINNKEMVVEVSILESELAVIDVGQKALVKSLAYPDKHYSGTVSEINPMVNEQGLVLIKVKITNPDTKLFEGMNTQIIIEKNVANLVVIPKEAVVERSGKKVVFVFEDGLAKWNYVTVTHENSEEVAISEGLEKGQKVITKGNLNLGHDAKVAIEK